MGRMSVYDKQDFLELFSYHATDGILNYRDFAGLITEGMSYSFLDGMLDAGVKGDLRVAIAAGTLPSIGDELLRRIFSYVNISGSGAVGFKEIAAFMQTIAYGTKQER